MALLLPETLPTLRSATGRFVLAPFGPEDVEPLAHILANDEIWSQGYGDGAHRPGDHFELIDYVHTRYAGHTVFSIFYTGLPGGPLFIGTTGITDVQSELERAKVGRTVISPAFWGVQANHEVKMALLDWLFFSGAGRIECEVDPRNQRSLSSLARFGFTIEGTRRRSSRRADGSWRDIVVVSLLTEEWAGTRQRAMQSLEGFMPGHLVGV